MRRPVNNEKQIVRSGVKVGLGAMTAEQRGAESGAICAALMGLGLVASARRVLLYAAMPFEPEVGELARWLLSRGAVVCAPRVDWAGWTMVAAEVSRWPDDLALDAKGLRVPGASARVVGADELDAVLVPGVAFDREGARLGRGGGFYDRFLAGVKVQSRVGVCFGCQVVTRVPTEPHDARMGAVVTGAGVLGVLGVLGV